MNEFDDGPEEPTPAYRVHDSVSYFVKCTDDGYPEDWMHLDIFDWIEKGKWYRVLGIIGSKDLSFAEFIVYDNEDKRIIQASDEIFSFPSSMFDLKKTYMVCNN